MGIIAPALLHSVVRVNDEMLKWGESIVVIDPYYTATVKNSSAYFMYFEARMNLRLGTDPYISCSRKYYCLQGATITCPCSY